MPATKFSISLRPETYDEVTGRAEEMDGNVSGTINRLLERYIDLLKRERHSLVGMFSDGEKGLILDSLNGLAFVDSVGIYHIADDVADAVYMDKLDKKWEVSGSDATAKLRRLSNGQLHALVDEVQSWWNRVGKGEEMTPAQLLEE